MQILPACVIFLLGVVIVHLARRTAALEAELLVARERPSRRLSEGRPARSHGAQPAARLPWGSADRDRALQALKKRHQALRTMLRNAHCCPPATSFDKSYMDDGYLSAMGPCKRRDAQCVAEHGSADTLSALATPNSSLAPFPSAMLSVNGRFLALDDILFGYEILHESLGMFSTVTFLGVALQQDPLDAFAIGDLLWRVRPRLLIELGTSGGGSALYYARLMMAYDPQAQVLTIDPARGGMAGVPLRNWNHAQIAAFCPNCTAAKSHEVWREHVTYLRETPTSETALYTARTLARRAKAEGLPVLVMEDSDHREEHVETNLNAYAPFVSIGSYLVVQDTRFGRFKGPSQAVSRFLERQERGAGNKLSPWFERDRRPEHFLFSQHSGGFLYRSQ